MPQETNPSPHWWMMAFQPARIVLICAVALTLLGLTILFSASASMRENASHFLVRQCIWVVIAVGAGFFISRLDLEYARRYAWIFAAGALVLLGLVLIPGIGVTVNGARRWLELGPMRVQPSEFAKIALVFALAHYCGINQRQITTFIHGFAIPCAAVGLFAIMIGIEPDFGTAALTGSVGFLMLFLAGVRLRYILPTVGCGLFLFAVAVFLSPMRMKRMAAFMDVEGTRSDTGYQLWQGLLGFAAGGVEGVGLGNGRQQIAFLPEAHTDFIFPIIGEELGLWFTLGTVCVFSVLFIAGWMHLRRAPNLFGYLLIAGALMLMAFQAIINFCVVTGLFPTKGMSLPFISYGGSNLVLMGIIVGLIFNTHRAWSRANLGPRRALQEVNS